MTNDSQSPIVNDPLASPKARRFFLGGLAVVALAGCFVLWLDTSARNTWTCSSFDIASAPSGPTERVAVDRYLETAPNAGVPKDGWSESEPSRMSQVRDSDQYVVDLNQVSTNQWVVVRIDHCGPGAK